MAPELLDTRDAAELVKLGLQIREYQTAERLSDNAMVKKFAGLGSTKTYTRICNNDLLELDLDRQLDNYRAVWAVIESLASSETTADETYEDFSTVLELKRAFAETARESGNARFILIEGDTGAGKTKSLAALQAKFGARVLLIEAMEVWNDNPNAFLGAILTALGIKDQPTLAVDRMEKVIQRLRQTRVCVAIDEAHHMGLRCLNTLKTLINLTPGEFIAAAYGTLWQRLQREAYEEARQLTGNRLAERLRFGTARENDILRLIARRVPAFAGMQPREVAAVEGVAEAIKLIKSKVQTFGNLAFVRDVVSRVVKLADGTAGPDLNCWSTAISQEVESR
jgi:DNA transposition AAA+ family ATPase